MSQLDDAVAVFVSAGTSMSSKDLLIVPRWERADWEKLFAHATPKRLSAGGVLIEKDDAQRTLYFITSGLLEVPATISGDIAAPTAKLTPGSTVGEVAFLDGNRRSAKVWASVDSELFALEYENYQQFAHAHPSLACELIFGIGRLVAFRFRRTLALTLR